MVSLAQVEKINDESGHYLNRLSDPLFVVSRVLARTEDGVEILWMRGDKRLPSVG